MKQTEQILGKMEWRKPALVVLVRRKPEESVLTSCKMFYDITGGPLEFDRGCRISGCPECMTFVSS
jgi:hypothetical protein